MSGDDLLDSVNGLPDWVLRPPGDIYPFVDESDMTARWRLTRHMTGMTRDLTIGLEKMGKTASEAMQTITEATLAMSGLAKTPPMLDVNLKHAQSQLDHGHPDIAVKYVEEAYRAGNLMLRATPAQRARTEFKPTYTVQWDKPLPIWTVLRGNTPCKPGDMGTACTVTEPIRQDKRLPDGTAKIMWRSEAVNT